MAHPIENLRMWKSGSWVRYESKSSHFLLRLQYDQLLITTEDKVLESLNINGKLKGIIKDDILLLIISVTCQEVRRNFYFIFILNTYLVSLRTRTHREKEKFIIQFY